jgi:CDP-glucose 4,6-dehydratase
MQLGKHGEMRMFNNIYSGKKILVTGNTGFKGSWLTLWLKQMGAEVFGISKDIPTSPSLHQILNLDYQTSFSDIRNLESLKSEVNKFKPDIVFHLAAQALVRPSYADPHETFETNVMGTVNILEAIRNCTSVKAVVIVTSDKCYENNDWIWGYRENDKLGGRDPYSASKGCAEIVTNSYRQSFFENQGPLVASVRAGNVIGGGDWSQDRLIPDIVRATTNNEALILRNPQSTRPWQHVLEPLSGYLLLGQSLLENKRNFAEAFNFGPQDSATSTVEEIVKLMKTTWGNINVSISKEETVHEAALLKLDSSKASNLLKWKPVWNLNKAVNTTAYWYKNFAQRDTDISEFTNSQLDEYVKDALEKESVWVKG